MKEQLLNDLKLINKNRSKKFFDKNISAVCHSMGKIQLIFANLPVENKFSKQAKIISQMNYLEVKIATINLN